MTLINYFLVPAINKTVVDISTALNPDVVCCYLPEFKVNPTQSQRCWHSRAKRAKTTLQGDNLSMLSLQLVPMQQIIQQCSFDRSQKMWITQTCLVLVKIFLNAKTLRGIESSSCVLNFSTHSFAFASCILPVLERIITRSWSQYICLVFWYLAFNRVTPWCSVYVGTCVMSGILEARSVYRRVCEGVLKEGQTGTSHFPSGGRKTV